MTQANATGRTWVVFLIVSIVLALTFLWRFFTPAHEYPMTTARNLTMLFDACMIAGLIGTFRKLSMSGGLDERKGFATALFWVALAAGIGLFAIRLTSTAAWWTGHRLYWLLPR